MEYKDIATQEQELRADPLYDLLREHRPQPPRESRAQVRRTLDRIETPPFAWVGTFARRAPVGFAAACIALVLLLCLYAFWKDKLGSWKWLLWASIICIPLVYICGQSGWVVAEVGRQPWTIQGLLPVNVAISSLSAGAVKTTFFVFLAVFALFLAIEIRIMIRAIGKGPEVEPQNS